MQRLQTFFDLFLLLFSNRILRETWKLKIQHPPVKSKRFVMCNNLCQNIQDKKMKFKNKLCTVNVNFECECSFSEYVRCFFSLFFSIQNISFSITFTVVNLEQIYLVVMLMMVNMFWSKSNWFACICVCVGQLENNVNGCTFLHCMVLCAKII